MNTTKTSDSPIAQAAAWIVAIGLVPLAAHLFATPQDVAALSLRDLTVYQSAIDAFAAGGNPYKAAHHAHGLFFTAPPFVWELYKLAAHSGLRSLIGPILLTADAVSVAVIPLVLGRLLLGPGLARAALAVGFFFAAFAGSGLFTALVINNGTPLYALIALALIPAVVADRWLAFHLAVALATAFKPFYAAFWLVPLLADRPSARRLAESAAAFALAATSYLAPAVLAPKLMAEWLHALTRETIGVGLLGDSLLAALIKSHESKTAAYGAQLLFSAVLAIAALLLGRLDRRQRIAGLLMIAVFLNPRAMRYDLSTAAVPLLALASGAFVAAPAGLLVQTAWAAVLAGVMIAFSHNAPTDGVLYAAVAVGGLVVAIVGGRVAPASRRHRA